MRQQFSRNFLKRFNNLPKILRTTKISNQNISIFAFKRQKHTAKSPPPPAVSIPINICLRC